MTKNRPQKWVQWEIWSISENFSSKNYFQQGLPKVFPPENDISQKSVGWMTFISPVKKIEKKKFYSKKHLTSENNVFLNSAGGFFHNRSLKNPWKTVSLKSIFRHLRSGWQKNHRYFRILYRIWLWKVFFVEFSWAGIGMNDDGLAISTILANIACCSILPL